MNVLSKTLMELMYIEPFVGHFALGVNKYFSDQVPTAAVTIKNINVEILFNELFFNKLTDKQQIGLMWHEISHITHFHTIPEFYNEFEDKEILNIAEDIVINQYIPSDYLPPKSLLPSTFPKLKLPEFEETRIYYDLLKQNQNSANPDPKLKSLLDYMGNNPSNQYDHSSHRCDENGDEVASGMGDLIKKQITYDLQRVFEDVMNKQAGNIPSYLRGVLEDSYKKSKPVIDWRSAIRRLASRSLKIKTRSSRKKLNIRIPDSPAIKITPRQKMYVVIDTSGSISSHELSLFVDQIEHIHKNGVEVEIVECDAAVGRAYQFRSRQKIGEITGGGGTMFAPAFEYLKKQRDCNSVVFFTDGYPCDSYKNIFLKPCLWIITSNGTTNFDFPGTKILMDKSLC